MVSVYFMIYSLINSRLQVSFIFNEYCYYPVSNFFVWGLIQYILLIHKFGSKEKSKRSMFVYLNNYSQIIQVSVGKPVKSLSLSMILFIFTSWIIVIVFQITCYFPCTTLNQFVIFLKTCSYLYMIMFNI